MNKAVRRPTWRRRVLSAGAASLLGLTLAGCASGSGRTAGNGESPITVVVENTLIPSSSLSVWAVPDGGTQTLLGNVGPGETKALEYAPTSRALTFRLRARLTGGEDRVSNPVAMAGAQRVIWNLQSGLATVVESYDR